MMLLNQWRDLVRLHLVASHQSERARAVNDLEMVVLLNILKSCLLLLCNSTGANEPKLGWVNEETITITMMVMMMLDCKLSEWSWMNMVKHELGTECKRRKNWTEEIVFSSMVWRNNICPSHWIEIIPTNPGSACSLVLKLNITQR